MRTQLHDSTNTNKNVPEFSVAGKHQAEKQHTLNGIQNEKHSNLKLSNYKMFMQKWNKNNKYSLPDSFKLIQIQDRSDKKLTDQDKQFNLSILSYSCEQLCTLAVKIIKASGFEQFCSHQKIQELVHHMCLEYKAVSYHHFSHAFSLMHMLFQLTRLDTSFKNMYTSQQIGFCLISALAHDINHPGTNNAFQVKTKSQLAIQSSNESVLQKMHVRHFFQLLKSKKIDIFEKSTNPKKMKMLTIETILATDVSKHFKNLEELKRLFSAKQFNTQAVTEKQRFFYLEQVFHACDIGNPCLEYQEYINWAALLTYQFNTQTLMEAEKNVQITEMLKYKSLKGFYLGQVGFISKNYLVYPLWKELSNTWNGFSILVKNIETNLKLLQDKADNEKND